MIKQFNRFFVFVFVFVFVFGCYASANFLKASEEEVRHITVETADQIPQKGGFITFDSVLLPNLNNFLMALVALANDLKVPGGDSWVPLQEVPIYTEFFPAGDFQGPTTIYLPGSAGVKESEKKEIARLNKKGEHVFAIETNFSHVKHLEKQKKSNLSDEEIQKKASTSSDQLKANPLNQVADVMRLLKILQQFSLVDSSRITVMGSSLGGVSAALCALPEFAGPLTPGAHFVRVPEGKFDYDLWVGIPDFKWVVAIGPLLAIMPHNPRFNKKVMTFIGAEDNFCEPWSNIHVLQEASKSLNVTLDILEGVGHFPESSKEEYDVRVLSSKSGGMVYREETEDYFMRNGQNISGACFRLGHKVSFFRKKEEEDMGAYEQRITSAKFVLHGRGPWNEGVEKSLMGDFVKLQNLITRGTSIKPDPIATDYIHARIDQLKKLSGVRFKLLALDHHHSLQGVRQPEDMEGYNGFVTKKQMRLVSKESKVDEDDLENPFR